MSSVFSTSSSRSQFFSLRTSCKILRRTPASVSSSCLNEISTTWRCSGGARSRVQSSMLRPVPLHSPVQRRPDTGPYTCASERMRTAEPDRASRFSLPGRPSALMVRLSWAFGRFMFSDPRWWIFLRVDSVARRHRAHCFQRTVAERVASLVGELQVIVGLKPAQSYVPASVMRLVLRAVHEQHGDAGDAIFEPELFSDAPHKPLITVQDLVAPHEGLDFEVGLQFFTFSSANDHCACTGTRRVRASRPRQ